MGDTKMETSGIGNGRYKNGKLLVFVLRDIKMKNFPVDNGRHQSKSFTVE